MATPLSTPGLAEILARSPKSDWRALDSQNTLYLETTFGRVVVEFAPAFAKQHVVAVKALARSGYFDNSVVFRVEDNYVAQFGHSKFEPEKAEQLVMSPEFVRVSEGFGFLQLMERDAYASEVGFSDGFPVGRDPASRTAWLVHCYGMVGIARDDDPQSGTGHQLYVVIGHSPRQLDRNSTLVGRVIFGIEFFSSLPRGKAERGAYDETQHAAAIVKVRLALDVPFAEQTHLEVVRDGSTTHSSMLTWMRSRRDTWNIVPAGHVDLCNVPIGVRQVTDEVPASAIKGKSD